MRRTKILILVAMLSFSFTSQAEESDRSMAISVSPLALIGGGLDTLFQYNLGSFLSLTIPFHFQYFWPASTLVDTLDKSASKGTVKVSKSPIAVGGGLGARFYPFAKGMNDGFYLGPKLVLSYNQFGMESASSKVEWELVTFTPKAELGWDWFWDSGFYTSFGANLGLAYDMEHKVKVESNDKEVKKAIQTSSKIFPAFFPNPDERGRFAWDLEFKIGFSW